MVLIGSGACYLGYRNSYIWCLYAKYNAYGLDFAVGQINRRIAASDAADPFLEVLA